MVFSKLISDVRSANATAKADAKRELGVTLVVALAAFIIGPLVFVLIILPPHLRYDALFESFFGSDIYISAVALLSIAVYSVSRAYDVEERAYFNFPHAASILTASVLIVVIAAGAHTARLFTVIMPQQFVWRGWLGGGLGILVFIITALLSYAVLVLRNDIDGGSARRMHDDQEQFVDQWNKQV